jgi:hypothetical protein
VIGRSGDRESIERMGGSSCRACNGWTGRAEDSASDTGLQTVFVHPISRSPDLLTGF